MSAVQNMLKKKWIVTPEDIEECLKDGNPIKSQLCAAFGEGSHKEIELRIYNPFKRDIGAYLYVIDHNSVVGEFPAVQIQQAVDLFNSLP